MFLSNYAQPYATMSLQSGSPAKTNGGSQAKSGNSILSPPQLKKPTPAPVQGPLGSDLLKAIRDGESAA